MYSVQQKKNQRLFLRENTSPCQLFFDSSLFQGHSAVSFQLIKNAMIFQIFRQERPFGHFANSQGVQ